MKTLFFLLLLAGTVPTSSFAQPLALLNTLDTDSQSECYALYASGYGNRINGNWEASYDTLRLFWEHCYQEPNSWEAFIDVNGAISQWGGGGAGRWPDYLTWLKSVLYLNSDTSWYCDDVDDMITAVQNNEAPKMAIAQYVVENNRCPNLRVAFEEYYNAASHWRHEFWLDSIVTKYDTVQYNGVYSWWVDSMVNKDTMANPYDSTIPTLWQDSLEILLGSQNAVAGASSPISSQALLDARLLENPMQDEIDVSFEMGSSALVTMELRDILGRSIPLTYAKYQLESPGTHEARIPAPNLPPGTYYLRITTDTGDVITLKVVKQ
ncbi:MAG TPA: T9SS type A sorting domain-containing protein [Candidatus Kapabacteria bacterium]|nr:T9SS type A sorting domain-containing protein [Candidatus Kapabacteria bacterium]